MPVIVTARPTTEGKQAYVAAALFVPLPDGVPNDGLQLFWRGFSRIGKIDFMMHASIREVVFVAIFCKGERLPPGVFPWAGKTPCIPF